jgi:hypothetical protein
LTTGGLKRKKTIVPMNNIDDFFGIKFFLHGLSCKEFLTK